MSKHAIEGLTDSLAAQLAPLGVRVSVVEPRNYRSNIDDNFELELSFPDSTHGPVRFGAAHRLGDFAV